MAKAQEVFDELPEHDVISWNALISGYAEHGSGDEALNRFSKMKNEGLSPDAVTFSCILKVCGNLEYPAMGEAIHQEIREQGLVKNNVSLGAALVDMYSRCKMLRKAQEAFEELSVRNVLLWNTLISGYAQHELGDEALRCYKQMQVEGHVPDVVTFVSSLKACCSIGALEMGEEIYAEVDKRSLLIQHDVALGTALIDMYSKNGIVSKAREVFDSLPKRNVVTWNALLTGYAQSGRAQTAMLLFHKMLVEDIGPDRITFLVLLNACNHGGFVEEGQIVFDAMTRSYKLSASCEHRSCMIDLLAHAGHFEKAMRFIEDVAAVCSNRLHLYLALLSACRKCLNVELGTWAFHRSIRIDERCGAAYVCMRNLLAAAGK
jgi:pentatricopeptide repeat protein